MNRDFDSYYDEELLPRLRDLEARRAAAVSRFWKTLAVCLLVGGAAVAGGVASRRIVLVIGGTGIAIAGILLAHTSLLGPISKEAKREVVGSVARFVEASLRYDPEDCITEREFRNSMLFRQDVDRYRGEDLVAGRIGATEIRFSEVHAEYRTSSTNSKGHTRHTYHTIFKGLFLLADFNKHLRGMTLVLPDVAEKSFGWLGQKLQAAFDAFRRGELVKLEDPEFEREFVVYADDQVEARYVLTPALMQRLLDFRRKTGHRMYFSFLESRVYIAIETGRDMFEVGVFQDMVDRHLVKKHLRDLQFAVSVVAELDLNTRIWTKD
jgi:hypothetical protein